MFTIRIAFWMADTVTWLTDGPGIQETLAQYDTSKIRDITITANSGD